MIINLIWVMCLNYDFADPLREPRGLDQVEYIFVRITAI